MFYVIGLHFGTGIIGVNLTLRKQASDYTWRPIIDVLLYILSSLTDSRAFIRVNIESHKHLESVCVTLATWTEKLCQL